MDTHPLEALTLLYLSQKDVTRGTYELYRIILHQYIEYLKNHQILYAKTSDVLNYRDWKRNQGYSSRWLYLQISTIKGLYQYLSKNQKRLDLPEIYADDITEPIRNERIRKTISKAILTITEARHLILCTKNSRRYIWHYRDHAIIYLMITTGMRSVEIRRAKKKDLRIVDHQLILYVQGKGRSYADAFVKISPGVEEAINDYLCRRKDQNPYLFISHSQHTDVPCLSRTFFIRMFERVLAECDLTHTKITPHSLRHTAAMMNLQRGGSLEATSQFMRHRNLSSTLIYAHPLDTMTEDSEKQIENYILREEIMGYGDVYIIIDL